jgi:hypothetical protein
MLLPASNATVEWNAAHSRWEVHIFIGSEVIKRPIPGDDSSPEGLTRQAVAIARDEGYELSAEKVTVAARV